MISEFFLKFTTNIMSSILTSLPLFLVVTSLIGCFAVQGVALFLITDDFSSLR